MPRLKILDANRARKQANPLFLRYYVARLAHALSSPTTFSLYVVAAWSLTADLGLTRSFPWPQGPLSNWLVWLGLGLAFRTIPSAIYRASK